MAKKQETLTPEERLQAALVPESEQPYKVPENWCWTQLGELYQINPKNLAEDFMDAAFIPMEKIAPGFVNEYSFDVQPWYKAKKGHTQFADGDVAFAKISPCFENRKSMLLNNLPNGIGGGTTELVILRQSHMNPQYTFWFVSQEQFIRSGIATYSGTVGQQRISMDYVRTCPIPVPPLPEQQRIVDRIESLFAKLDEAKQKAQDALDSFETRKAAILHKAFTGELTAQWRKEHEVGMESWKNTALQDVCEKIVCGKTPTESIHPTGEIPYLKVYNIVDNNIDFKSTPQFIPKEIHEGRLKSSILKPHDVVMNIVGPPLRKIAIIPDDYPEWNMNQAIVRFRPCASLQYRFLYYALVNPKTLDGVISKTKGVVGQANISVTQSRNLVIPLPSVSEQAEIVLLLDALLAKERQAKEAAEGVLEQIDLIKKAILARAFRGELGTNDPSEESAVELLKKLL